MAFIEWGKTLAKVTPDVLPDAPLRALLRTCQEHPDIDVVELRCAPDGVAWHAIVVDAGDGTVAPRNAAGIYPRERLALIYRPAAEMPFEVRALRDNFPETLHQNAVGADEPCSLCLYDQPWSALERGWTPGKFLTRILQWLEGTASGSLHADDQVLEQLFFDSGLHVILPAGFTQTIQDRTQTVHVNLAHQSPQRVTLVASVVPAGTHNPWGATYQPLTCELNGVAHPPIQGIPRSLGELEARLQHVGSSLFPALVHTVREAATGGIALTGNDVQRKTLLLLRIPRLRDGQIERTDVLGFVLHTDVARLGLVLGVLQQVQPQGPAYAFDELNVDDATTSPQPPSEAWQAIGITPVHVRHSMDRSSARYLSGLSESNGVFRGVLAGVGALGSALTALWAREAWGCWDLVDPDVVEPHNVVRHLAHHGHVGLPKVEVVHGFMQSTLGESCTDTLALRTKANATGETMLDVALSRAHLLVDATTTLEVPRDWSQRDVPRAASIFLTPSGGGSVLLLEDAARIVRLAALEAQYYRAVLREDWGNGHLHHPQSVRLGAACRDRSLVMSASQIGLHAALLSQGLQRSNAQASATVWVWSQDAQTSAVTFHDVPVHAVRQQTMGAWIVYWDVGLEEEMRAMRKQALPNETGGILLGTIDHKAHTIHLVEACPAPVDSVVSLASFTRGKHGVAEARQACLERTRGMVDYVGEWHSHPRATSATPSMVDVELLSRLANSLSADGVPALMVIVGDKGDVSVSLGELT